MNQLDMVKLSKRRGASCHRMYNKRATITAGQDPILLRAARGEVVERPPVWLMRQAGRYMAEFRKYSEVIPFRERSETPEIAVELSLQPWRAFRPDGVIMFSDILTPLPAMGVEFDVVRGKGPRIDQPLRTADDLLRLREMADVGERCTFLAPILGALREHVKDEAAVLGFIGSPWTLAAYAIEGKADRHCQVTKTMMMRDPELLHQILEHITDAIAVYACHQIQCGAQVVQVFDSWAHHLSPAQFSEFSMPYAQRVMDHVKAQHPEVPLIFHANGGTGKLHRIQKECRADVIGLDWACDMAEARAIFGPDQTLQGNVDPMVLFGTEDAIRKAVKEVVDAAGPRHILGVGHGVVQGTPEENVGLFCEFARQSSYAASVIEA